MKYEHEIIKMLNIINDAVFIAFDPTNKVWIDALSELDDFLTDFLINNGDKIE